MKVKQLRKLLQSLPQDAKVYMSRDPEGNGFSPLSTMSESWYYDGDCISNDDVTWYVSTGEDQVKKAPKVICLWPKH